MLRLPASSGDLGADRRLGFAQALAAEGDAAGAAEVMEGALHLAPGWVAGWYALGEMREAAGLPQAAADAWQQALRLDPADRLGASLRLALVAPDRPPQGMPSAFVETLFDGYAPDFDTSLVDRLGYRGPQAVAAALPDGRFAEVLDLGCGTGLMGAALRDRCDRLEGWDISAGMLRQAAAKGLYDRLDRVDLAAPPAPEPTRDLIVAADVFNYLGPLETILHWSAQALTPGGLLAFIVEAHDGPGLALGAGRRFRHGRDYLTSTLAAAGLTGARLSDAVMRMDRGAPVPALVAVAYRPVEASQA